MKERWSALWGKSKSSREDADAFKSQAMIHPELAYDKKGYELKLTGAEKVDGEPAYKIEIISPDGSKSTEYFSIESGLKLKTVTTQDGAGFSYYH